MESEMSNPHQQAMYDALQGYKQKHGQPGVRALLESVAGVTAGSLVPEDRMQAVINACVRGLPVAAQKKAKSLSRPRNLESIATNAYAHWNNPPVQQQD
jgi:hypothetical protein